MTFHRFHYQFRNVGASARSGNGDLLTDNNFHTTVNHVRKVVRRGIAVPRWAEDLLRIARAVSLADALSDRAKSADKWTREIHLTIQVGSTTDYTTHVVHSLESLLGTLTSDVWDIDVEGGAEPIDDAHRLFKLGTASEIALFSGGLDSSAYAMQRARSGHGILLLLGHDIGGARKPQERLWSRIRTHHSVDRTVTFQKMSDRPRGPVEKTTRSRGFLFAATAVYAAAAHDVPTVAVPENGQLAINPALTPGRVASCSTRSVHPLILAEINELIETIGGSVTLENPYLLKTKGDVCTIAKDNGLEPVDLAATESCGSHSAKRWPARNCGTCFPCLVRRSGLTTALGRDPTIYGRSLSSVQGLSLRHLRDLQSWLARDFTVGDLLSDLPLPERVQPRQVLRVIDRGRDELRAMLRRHGQWAPTPR